MFMSSNIVFKTRPCWIRSTSVAYNNVRPIVGDFQYFSTTAKKDDDDDDEVKPVWYVPRSERSERSVFLMEENRGDSRMVRYDRACPTRELNFTPDSWQKHKSPYRKLRHVSNLLKSSPFQRLMFPDLALVSGISIGLSYYNSVIALPGAEISIGSGSFAGITTAIGMLAGFRLNASYGRYEECRIFWGETNNTIRDLAQQTMIYMRDEDQRSRMLKLCKAYPVVLNFHLNAKGGHHNIRRTEASEINMVGDSPLHLDTEGCEESVPKKVHDFDDRVHAEFKAELRDIYTDGCHDEDYERICKIKYSGANTPIELLTMMRETIGGCIGNGVDGILIARMDQQCERLCGVFGASERVLRTALPTGFTRHSSRLMFMWSNLLPFALYPACGPIGTLPAALMGAYALLGIEDVGVQLEEPFDILPLRQYSDGMFDAIGQVERNFIPYIPPSSLESANEGVTITPIDPPSTKKTA